MMRMAMVFVVLAACGPDKDYSGKKLVEHTVTKDGVTYTVMIPDGLPKNKREEGDWFDARMEYDHVPQVFTGPYPAKMPATAEEANKDIPLSPEKATIVRTQQRADGWSVTLTRAKDRIEASSYTKIGDKIVKCTAVQNGDGDIDNFDKTKTMLEAVCDSIKAK
jgi:hypothetical protein